MKLLCRILLLPLCFMLPTAANAQNASVLPPYMHIAPGNADIATYGGDANTLVVHIVNLTPYNIAFKEGAQWTNLQDVYGPLGSDAMLRNIAKAFMFAPLGVPQQLPSPPPQAFVPPFLPTGQPNPDYDRNWKNTETRPYNMVFSWDDHDGGVTPNWVTWTIQGVPCKHDDRCPPTGTTQDVDLGLWITRDIPQQDKLTAGKTAELVIGILTKMMGIISVVVEPENPLAWVHFFLIQAELGLAAPEQIEAFNERQTCDMTQGYLLGCDSDRHGQWWIAAHTYPDPYLVYHLGGQTNYVPNSCYTTAPNSSCDPASYKANDAVETHWDADIGGLFTKTIVVTTHVLRGHQATASYGGRSDCLSPFDQRGKLGSAPVVMVTVMTEDQYVTAKIATLPLSGIVSTSGTAVVWSSGSQFTCLQPGEQITINNVSYTVQSVNSTTSLTLTSPAPIQKNVSWSAAALCGSGGVVSAMAPGASPPAPGKTVEHGVHSGPDLIRSLVGQYGLREALVQLHSIISVLPNVQREFLRELIKSRIAGNPPTPKEEAFVYMIAARLRDELR